MIKLLTWRRIFIMHSLRSDATVKNDSTHTHDCRSSVQTILHFLAVQGLEFDGVWINLRNKGPLQNEVHWPLIAGRPQSEICKNSRWLYKKSANIQNRWIYVRTLKYGWNAADSFQKYALCLKTDLWHRTSTVWFLKIIFGSVSVIPRFT